MTPIPAAALLVALPALLYAANRFVTNAAAIARHLGLSPLLIGMLVIGFGTSAPELLVSALAATQGNPALALGNAYGSNITNIALILGATALISPITVQSGVLRKELPLLVAVTALAAWQLRDGLVSRADAVVLLVVFGALMAWSIRVGRRGEGDGAIDSGGEAEGNGPEGRGGNEARNGPKGDGDPEGRLGADDRDDPNAQDTFGTEVEHELDAHAVPMRRAVIGLLVGLVLLVASARALVWAAVEIARGFGVSDLVIGLTIVAIGTSLPELASSIVAARKGEHDLALGNVLGSNLFNTLGVVGLAGVIQPAVVSAEVLTRDVLVMGVLTVGLFVVGYGFRGPGRINRVEGAVLVLVYVGYMTLLMVRAG